MTDIPLDKCSLLAVFVESGLWGERDVAYVLGPGLTSSLGLFFPIYLITVFLLLQKKTNIANYVPYVVLASVMFILCTTVRPLSSQER